VEKLEDLLTIDESELRVRMNEASLTSKWKRQDTAFIIVFHIPAIIKLYVYLVDMIVVTQATYTKIG
jgi:hypothetical protein